jgi:hypothetical protein
MVEDLQCGRKSGKVQVCHNGQAICVAPTAVATHLGHGAQLGSYPNKTAVMSAKAVASVAFRMLPSQPRPIPVPF